MFIPILIWNGSANPSFLHFSCNSNIRSCILSAISTQARASSFSPLLSGSPKNTIIASPIYLSMVAPQSRAIVVISEKYSFRYFVKSSGCKPSEVDVKFLMSLKNIVTFLRRVVIPLSYSPKNNASWICGGKYFPSLWEISSNLWFCFSNRPTSTFVSSSFRKFLLASQISPSDSLEYFFLKCNSQCNLEYP